MNKSKREKVTKTVREKELWSENRS